MKKLNVIILGKNGMLGSKLTNILNIYSDILNIKSLSHEELDITNEKQLKDELSNNYDYVINCSAFTNTYKCQQNDGLIESYKINVIGPYLLSKFCNEYNSHLIHISTDFVYSEYSNEFSIDEFPINTYGVHKLLAEKYIAENIKDRRKYSILRTSWLFGETDNKLNYIDKFLLNCRKTNDKKVNVVIDQKGRPTSTEFLSYFIFNCIINEQFGIIDAQPNNDPISRYDFSKIILECSKDIFDFTNGIGLEKIKSNDLNLGIMQPKEVPHLVKDDSCKYLTIIKNLNSDYKYWISKYLNENKHQIEGKIKPS